MFWIILIACPGPEPAQEEPGAPVDASKIDENAMFRKNEGFGEDGEGEE